VKQNITVEGCGGVELLTSWQPGNEERKGLETRLIMSEGMPLSDLL
jgi:hypothetical protein